MKFVDYNGIKIPVDPPLQENMGVKEGAIAGAWKAGVNSKVKYEIVLPSADWRKFWFNPERQYFDIGDTFACTNFSDDNSAKVQLNQSTGIKFDFSESASANLSGTQPNVGNYMDAPSEAARKFGRVLQSNWPNGNSVDEFYRTFTDDDKKKAVKFNEAHEYVPTDRNSLIYHLKQTPLNLMIKAGSTNHDVCALFIDNNGIWCGDSYPHNTSDNFIFITTQVPLAALKNIVKPMSNTYLIQLNKKDGTKEFALSLPATTEDALIDKALNTGYPLPTLNNGKNVDWPNVQPRFVINE